MLSTVKLTVDTVSFNVYNKYYVCHQTVDHIEASVEVAATRVEKGNRQLGSAVKAKV